MQIVKKYYEKVFSTHNKGKENYLEAMKWLALNVISVDSIYDTLFEIDKKDSGEIVSIIVIYGQHKKQLEKAKSRGIGRRKATGLGLVEW